MSNDPILDAFQRLNKAKEDEQSALIGLVIALALLLATPFAAMYHGWALWLIWNWFAVPLAPAITWNMAVGLSLLIGFIKMKPITNNQKTRDSLKYFLTFQISVLLFVAICWGFHAAGFGVRA